MEDLQAIYEVINQLALGVDTRRWDAVRALFADEVMADYTSLWAKARRS